MRLLKIAVAAALAGAALSACKVDLDGVDTTTTTTRYVTPAELGDWRVTSIDLDKGMVTCQRGDDTKRFAIDSFTGSFLGIGGICPE